MRKMNLILSIVATAGIALGSLSAQEKTPVDLSVQQKIGAQEEASANVHGELKQDVATGIEDAVAPLDQKVSGAEAADQAHASGAAKVNAQTDGVQGSGNAQANASGKGTESWRYRDYNGRKWYWQGDPKTGSWSYLQNGNWIPYRATANGNAQSNAGVQSQDSAYHGPYYFDASGRRFTRDGNTYTPDQTYNNRVWNDNYGQTYRNDYQNNYRNYWNNNTHAYSGSLNAGANVGGAIGQAIGDLSNGQIRTDTGAAIQGGYYPNTNAGGNIGIQGATSAGANVGGAIGQAIGGQAGGQIGAGIGAAIGQGR